MGSGWRAAPEHQMARLLAAWVAEHQHLRADKSAVVALEKPAFGLIAYVPHWLQTKLTTMDGDSAAAIAENQLH